MRVSERRSFLSVRYACLFMDNTAKDLDYYAELFSKVARGRNTHKNSQELSPYKPILLLSIIEMISKGIILENKIITNGSQFTDLKHTFTNYQNIFGGVYKDKKSVIHQPFDSLRNDKQNENGEPFWHLKNNSGTPEIEDIRDTEGKNRIKSEARLRHFVEYGKFDDELWDLLQEAEARSYLVDLLMDTFFSNQLNNQVDETINIFDQDAQKQSQEIREPKDTDKKEGVKKYVVRDSLFRRSIIHIYKYQCAVCRLNINLKPIDSRRHRNIVDAAHIKPFSLDYNNQLNNGISLCKNHHWAFDNGCFGIDENNYSIIVANNFSEDYDISPESLNITPMKRYHGQKILLPVSKQYQPSLEALVWHRQKHRI